MSRRNKKRTKRYSGEDAKTLSSPANRPVVHHYEAITRSPLGEWWQTKKLVVKFSAWALLIIVVLVLVVYQLIRLL